MLSPKSQEQLKSAIELAEKSAVDARLTVKRLTRVAEHLSNRIDSACGDPEDDVLSASEVERLLRLNRHMAKNGAVTERAGG